MIFANKREICAGVADSPKRRAATLPSHFSARAERVIIGKALIVPAQSATAAVESR